MLGNVSPREVAEPRHSRFWATLLSGQCKQAVCPTGLVPRSIFSKMGAQGRGRPCHVCKPNTLEKWRPKGTRIHPGRFGPPMEWVKELDSPCCLRYYSKLDLGSVTVLGCRLTRSDWLLRPKTPAPRTIFFSGWNCTGSVQVAKSYLIDACVFFRQKGAVSEKIKMYSGVLLMRPGFVPA